MEFGFEGVGIWWTVVELMHSQADGKFEKFPAFYSGLAYTLGISEEKVKAFFQALISRFNLFREDDRYIWSERVQSNLRERLEKRLKKVEAGRMGGVKSGESRSKLKHNEAVLEANESKVKERKGKDSEAVPSEPSKISRFIKPTVELITAYCTERNNNINGSAFFDFYESKGWLVGKVPMRDWKAAVRTWEKNEYGGGSKKEVKTWIDVEREKTAELLRQKQS